MGRSAKPAKAKGEARPSVARKSRKAGDSAGRRLEQRLAEALEQQAATNEILRVISQSHTDVQPVFDAIVHSAVRLCGADHSIVTQFDGDLLHAVAHHGFSPEAKKIIERTFPMRPGPQNIPSRVALSKAVINLPDILADPMYSRDYAMAGGWRSGIGVPMLRDGALIGAIAVSRRKLGAFPEHMLELLKTFADQAVIAIENMRLFKELEIRNRDLTEALEQQTATSDILRVISQSPRDVKPVFDTIAAAALKLCSVSSAAVMTYDGELIHLVATANVNPEGANAVRGIFPRPPSRDMAATRAILTSSVVAIPDVLEDPEFAARAVALATGFRSALSIPLMRDGSPIGAITAGRPEPGPFPESQIALLKTFADQAVIAIENVRLFKELETRNRDLTEALEQQTATSEILRVISRSPRDVQPVFDTIAAAALKLCAASTAIVATFDGKLIRVAALANLKPEEAEAVHQVFPRPPSRENATARAVLTCDVVVIPDVSLDPDYVVKAPALKTGFRSILAVPLTRDGRPIGAITVGRPESGPFADKQIALLQTFANQAVIAIENVRLFKELEARTTDLMRSVGELRALGEVGQAVSSTLDLETVLSTIVSRATQLAGMDGGSIWEYDETNEEFHLHATDKLPDELIEALRAPPIKKGEGAVGRLAVTAEPVQIRDIVDEGVYQSRVREILIRLGYRSLLAVPLLREDRLLGGLAVNRKSAGEFAPEVIDLMKTFATQSALAIQNARLFREIETKSRELEIASQHKSEFLANMSHELRTPLNAIIGFSEVLYERMFGEINDKQAEYLSDILESGRHLLSLINDILDLSKIEAGRMELEPSEFDLPTAIENTLILVRERAQRREITLRRTVDERLGMIRADERKVKQVLLNLLSNALKFTPEGGRIDVVAGLHDGVTEISVTDTGVGIAPEDQEAVFEEFRQVGTAARKVEGTGLGLAISRKFIELHGGRIWVKSQPGVGSTFAFTLPLTIDQRYPTG
jgi:GAF domain-containing protein